MLNGTALSFTIQSSKITLMRQPIAFFLLSCLAFAQASAFCGFYVAKAGAQLFNKTSQVILVRQGDQTVVTMQSDYEGELKDFAMVVPVPEILRRDQIRIVESDLFDKLDHFTGPRLVEYHDEHPCYGESRFDAVVITDQSALDSVEGGLEKKAKYGVTVEAIYDVGEYTISILSATESNGLKKWLTQNGYKIPSKASKILAPYIQNGMKFFVVKVNLEKMKAADSHQLRPIQMTFRSEKFLLPIRLGMANAKADQDMIIHAFSDQGRVEPTNYRNVEIPADEEIPEYVEERFGAFYKSVFDKVWEEEGKNVVFTEYAWDLSADNFLKCDPCPSEPPAYSMLREAGVFWLLEGNDGPGANADYEGNVFLTRMHVRYNRKTFPQDLSFQVTPNKDQLQARYVIRHPVLKDDLDCKEGKEYLMSLNMQRFKALGTLEWLTGWEEPLVEEGYVEEVFECMRRNMNHSSWHEKTPEKDQNEGIPFWMYLLGAIVLWAIFQNFFASSWRWKV